MVDWQITLPPPPTSSDKLYPLPQEGVYQFGRIVSRSDNRRLEIKSTVASNNQRFGTLDFDYQTVLVSNIWRKPIIKFYPYFFGKFNWKGGTRELRL